MVSLDKDMRASQLIAHRYDALTQILGMPAGGQRPGRAKADSQERKCAVPAPRSVVSQAAERAGQGTDIATLVCG